MGQSKDRRFLEGSTMKNSMYQKKFIFTFVILFFTVVLCQSALAAQIKLAWDANSESDLAGYKVYYGTSPQSYAGSVDVGNVTSYTLTGLSQGQTYYVAMTAYNTSGSESGYSSEVSGVATETTLPVSETPPTVTPSPTSEPTTEPETPPKTAGNPPQTTENSSSTETTTTKNIGGCTRQARASTSSAKYIGTHLYVAVSEMSATGPSIGNIKKYEVATSEDPTKPSDPSNSTNSSNSSVQVGGILDAGKTPALDTDNLIKESSRSHWSREADGRQVDKGGVGEVLVTRSKRRNLFTNLGDSDLTSGSNAFSTSNEELTAEVLGLGPKDQLERERVIQYVQGYDPYTTNTKTKESTTLKKRRWILGSIVHSRPLVIHYGNEKAVIFVGANDGMLHAFEDETGEELWGFIPSELLSRLKDLARGGGLKYYVDGSPKAYITESKKIVIFGLRRGGSHYYALDVTDPERPRFLWKIGPETAGYSEMGQSWSTPHIGKIKYGTSERVVCFIGGGYDENQDRKTVTKEDKRGRAIYVVDVQTGDQLWSWDNNRDSEMRYSIPSDISRVDTNGDGYTDRLYVGDMGGRIWRFDIGDADTNAWSGRVFFNASLDGKRKIFYPPDVTLEKGYEMVFFGTGDREHPSETSVVNRFYGVKDKGVNKILSEGDLEDVTNGFSTGSLENNKEGWFISLGTNRGEKVTGVPAVAYGVVYFTTFSPSSSQSGENTARLYALNYKIGNAILNLNAANDTEGVRIELTDRSKVIGTGVPSGTVLSAVKGRLVAYTGIKGGIYETPVRKRATIIPVWWRQVF
jgi:type IV pilus assembly protein PilY1